MMRHKGRERGSFLFFLFPFSFRFQHVFAVELSLSAHTEHLCKQHYRTHRRDKKQGIYNLFAAYVHTVPLEQLIESVELARRYAQLRCGEIRGGVQLLPWQS